MNTKRLRSYMYVLFMGCMFTVTMGNGQLREPLFQQVDPEHSQLFFNNQIEETVAFNYYLFMHMYMGAGVATADFNNDGLPDIYFTSNKGENKLYNNKGNLQFEDVTEMSGTQGDGGFYTGVTTVDINNDGWLDIYVCRSGPQTDIFQGNLLYINNGDLTFTEASDSYGLSAPNDHSIQANFFDFDNDGDLDVYIVNTPVDFKMANQIFDLEKINGDHSYLAYGGSDKLYRNNGNMTFTDVSNEVGIKPDVFFGLTATVSDFNEDGFKDVFVANDFAGPDFLYINNGNGTFTDKAQQFFQHTSNYSMGADSGDLNNDGYQDLFVLDMLPVDYKRSKTSMSMMPREVMYKMVRSGYHSQYMHNVLQINNGIFLEDKPHFKELSYFSGIENTDWSWSCLIADFDLDGFNDIHVTNGILRDVTNMDARISEKDYVGKLKADPAKAVGEAELKKARSLYPSVKLANYLFKNNGNLTFQDISSEKNVGKPSFSNGSAYADFDNDGDLDLVCNNVNDNAFLFENLSDNNKYHYLKVDFNGPLSNPFAFGAKVKIYTDEKLQVKELQATRGYFSASEPVLHFGLGQIKRIDKLEVCWPDGKIQQLRNIKVDQKVTLNYGDAKSSAPKKINHTPIFKEATHLLNEKFTHNDISYDDFKDQLLLPHKLSNLGPCISTGDLNNDGLDDFFIGGASWFTGSVYMQQESGDFRLADQPDFELDKRSEDIAAHFFDANNDGFQDLYVVSGSYEMDVDDVALNDRLYLNNGRGKLEKANEKIPSLRNYGSCVTSLDFDKDGDLDIFVGGSTEKGKYPFSSPSYFLENESGTFTVITGDEAKVIDGLGMVTDVLPTDFDNDGDEDLIAVGEWMPITFLENENGIFKNKTLQYGCGESSGWWNTVDKADLDSDGDLDYIVGNLGLNYKFHASKEKPFHIYGNDFDNSGTVDIVLAKKINNELFPVRGKMCSTQQMPFIGDKFPSFSSFAEATITDILGSAPLQEALHLETKEFRSSILRNNGNNTFTLESLPDEAQYAPVNGILCHDFDNDGYIDLLLAGNKYESEVETSRADAGMGLFLKGNGRGGYEAIPLDESGFFVPGNIKTLENIKSKGGMIVLVGENNAPLQLFLNKTGNQ